MIKFNFITVYFNKEVEARYQSNEQRDKRSYQARITTKKYLQQSYVSDNEFDEKLVTRKDAPNNFIANKQNDTPFGASRRGLFFVFQFLYSLPLVPERHTVIIFTRLPRSLRRLAMTCKTTRWSLRKERIARRNSDCSPLAQSRLVVYDRGNKRAA